MHQGTPSDANHATGDAGDLLLTGAQWCNRLKPGAKKPDKVLAHGGNYDQFDYGRMYPYVPGNGFGYHPENGDGPLQEAVICSPKSGVGGIDVDTPAALEVMAAGQLVNSGEAWCTRGDGFHAPLDVRGIALNLIPRQGACGWGDWKWKGFLPRPGSLHYSGEPYEPTGKPVLTRATDDTVALLTAIGADRAKHAQALKAAKDAARKVIKGGGSAAAIAEAASSAAAGVFGHALAVGTHRELLLELLWKAGQAHLSDEQAYEVWLLHSAPWDASRPWTDDHFQNMWQNVPGKVADLEASHVSSAAQSLATVSGGTALSAGSVPDPSRADNPVAFDPVHAFDDQELADAVLYAMAYQARYAADAALWLWRGADYWEAQAGDVPASMLAGLADQMPLGISAEQAEELGLDTGDPEVKKEISRHYRRGLLRSSPGASRVASKIRARVAVAGTHPSALRLAELDADGGIIWAGGVPWDIGASADQLTVASLDPATPHLKSARYRPEAVATPLWDAFLAAVWPDKQSRAWALRLAGLAVTGHPEKAFPLLSGETDTGKTSFVEMLVDVLGSYATVVPPELMTGGGNAEYARFELKGVRLAFLDEAPRSGKIAQAALKQLTGGGTLNGRAPYGKPVTFKASHVLVATANPESDPPMTDDAVRGRIRLVPCYGGVAEVLAARAAIGYLHGEAWRQEAPGVLAQLITVAAQVLADPGIVRNDQAPQHVQVWGANMAREQNSIDRWYWSETEPSGAENRGTVLYADYERWCGKARPETHIAWGRGMVKLGSPGRRSHGVTWYRRKIRYRPYGDGMR